MDEQTVLTYSIVTEINPFSIHLFVRWCKMDELTWATLKGINVSRKGVEE